MRTTALLLLATCLSVRGAAAQTTDMTRLSLQDLLDIEVTSVSRKEQTLARTPAAVYVLTQEDIRRSGAKTIPDLLRMVPGVMVGQIDSSSWTISARGFNGLYASKLLVLVDGRSVYSPIFGGVHWDMQNTPIDDIDRIEVVRGPGGTLWGTNAVNGVINIITKPADATQGGLVTGRLGLRDQWFGDARYGGRLGNRTYFRLYGKHAEQGSDLHDATYGGFPLETPHPDLSTASVAGARLDWRNDLNAVSLHGSVQEGEARHLRGVVQFDAPWVGRANRPVTFSDRSVVGTWNRSHSSRAESGLQASFQQYSRLEVGTTFGWRVGELELRHRRAVGRRHDLVGGAGFRATSSTAGTDVYGLITLPPQHLAQTITGFLNDEINLSGTVRLTLGSKVEHAHDVGVEMQPSARVNWTPSAAHAFWGAVTRAVRTPTVLDRHVRAIGLAHTAVNGLPVLTLFEGSPGYAAEDMEALEAGYRWTRGPVSLDAAAFLNAYDGLRGVALGEPYLASLGGRAVLLAPNRAINLLEATGYGGEVSATWQPARWWKSSGSYARLRLTARTRGDQVDAVAPFMEAPAPRHQFHARTFVDAPGNVHAGALLYAASANPVVGTDRYTRLDLTVRWRAHRSVELSATAQNLLHDRDVEFIDVAAPVPMPVRSTVFGEVAWRF